MESFKEYPHTLDVHEFEGTFQGRPADFKMTSVIGHVLSIDFPPEFQDWKTTDPATLFAAPVVSAPIVSSEANPNPRQPKPKATHSLFLAKPKNI